MKLSVIVIAYNQEQYIEQTIRSIAMQKTNFDFEIIVGDDCSTDKTNEILQDLAKEIPNLKILSHKENLGIVGNFMSVYNAAQGKYISSTGGDDYWIDEQKLQRGVDFLEANKDYSMCCTGYKILYEEENKTEIVTKSTDEDVPRELLLKENPIAATTTMYRKSFIPFLDDSFAQVPVEDWVLWNSFAQEGKVRYFSNVTSVYRIHSQSVYSSIGVGKRLLWRLKSRLYILENFSNDSKEKIFISLKDSIKNILCDRELSKVERKKFLLYLKDKQWDKVHFGVVRFCITFDLRLFRSILWRLLSR